MAVYSWNHIKTINALCEQNEEEVLLNHVIDIATNVL
jgi:hypothetical protein